MNKVVLRYLPIFKEDLEEAITYIRDVLGNKQAAIELLNSVEQAIIDRSFAPESFEKYNSLKHREYPYYRIYV